MIIVRLQGGMGNQMFQYALGRALSHKHGVPLKLDVEIYKLNNHLTKRNYDLDIFNVRADIASKSEIPLFQRNYGNGKWLYYLNEIVRKLLSSKNREKSFNYNPEVLSLGPNVYLDGNWQSPKYFQAIEDIIRKDFTSKNRLAQNIQNLIDEIKNQNSLCIHVRRTDFIGNSFHEVVGNQYYNQGVEHISKLTAIDKIYVFSDDIKWCEKNMNFKFPTMFVGEEYAGKKAEGHLFIMSACKNFLIPNSTFSWWAAWLSDYKNKVVVCPKQWFPDASIDTGDIIPREWIRI